MATRAFVEECPQTYLLVGFFVFPMNLLIFLFFHFPSGKGGSRTLLTAMLLACPGHSGAWLAIVNDLVARAEVFCTRVSCFVISKLLGLHMIEFSFISTKSLGNRFLIGKVKSKDSFLECVIQI